MGKGGQSRQLFGPTYDTQIVSVLRDHVVNQAFFSKSSEVGGYTLVRDWK
jgi:hypothetical protein